MSNDKRVLFKDSSVHRMC